ncbi:MAG: ABC transporter permease [Lachnospiraceae bacterium]
MNILNTFTIKSLKKSKTRTAVTIVGIMLSCALIVAITSFAASFVQLMRDYNLYSEGNYYISAIVDDKKAAVEIAGDSRYNTISVGKFINREIIPDCDNDFRQYMYFMGVNDTFLENMPVHMISGHAPENEKELILPQNFTTNGGVFYELGDKIGEYTVVGFYERITFFENNWNDGFVLLTKVSADFTDECTYGLWFKLDKNDALEECEELTQKYGKGTFDVNYDLLQVEGVSRYSSVDKALGKIVALLVIIIMVGSIMLIYNSFAISISERTRQFGLLSSIGATKRQIRKAVLFEAFALSVAGIVLGIILGLAGTYVTLLIIGPLFDSIMKLGVSIHMTFSWTSILISSVVSLITVMISALVPAIRATHCNAIDAIRQGRDIKNENKTIKTSKLVGKLFGFEGTLATKYFKRNKKKYRITIFSLFVSIVLFISASSFASYLMKTVGDGYGGDNFDVLVSVRDDIKNELKQMDGVISVTKVTSTYLSAHVNDSDISFAMCIVDDESAEAFCLERGLKFADYTNPDKPLFIVKDRIRVWNGEEQKYNIHDVLGGKTEILEVNLGDIKKIEIGYIATELPDGCDAKSFPTILIPQSMATALDISIDNFSNYFIRTDRHSEVTTGIQKYFTESGASGEAFVYDIAASKERDRNTIIIINIFAYGFIIMISLIAITNVFNTISTNIMLRRKEFAMLKTVGMTRGGFNKMMNYECVLYGSRALLLGLPVSVLTSYLLYKYFNSTVEFGFYIPVHSIIIAIAVVFAVVFITCAYSMSKIKKENVIDVLKRENF